MKKYQITWTEGRTPFFLPMAQKVSRHRLKKIQAWRSELMGLVTAKNLILTDALI